VDHRTDGNGFIHRIDADVFARELTDEGYLRVDHLLAKMPEVQVDVMAVGAFEGSPLFIFLHMAARQDIPWTQLHLAMDRRVCRRSETVILEIPVAVLVLEPASFTARCLSDEDTGSGKSGGVILHELHP
jgi:hypothetical protein